MDMPMLLVLFLFFRVAYPIVYKAFILLVVSFLMLFPFNLLFSGLFVYF